ncbi:hypothetical protein [Streptomyces avidinii]|uniref:Cysteine dioxygenase type I n=1 Tax=Streptomyces avidinii TaxID=1895 RepID=A0ABS4KZV4_STRAV|nr:hypothetical protein [Streptomyces avidinii]MBP2034911.1 hypothetical protein [Streptomyces avidinii]
MESGSDTLGDGRSRAPEEFLEIAFDVAHDYGRWRPLLLRGHGESSWIQVFRTGDVGVWVLARNVLPPGSAFLDHEQVRGAVCVARGALHHERARLGSTPHLEEVGAGRGFCFDETFFHRLQAVPEAGPTVSVHVFALAGPAMSYGQIGSRPALSLGLP